MQPKPIADNSMPVLPSFRFCNLLPRVSSDCGAIVVFFFHRGLQMSSLIRRSSNFVLVAGFMTMAVSHFPIDIMSFSVETRPSWAAIMAISTATFMPWQNLL